MANKLFSKNALSKRENVRKWVKALRSGKFEQTTGALFDGTGYCCLGVAAKVCGFKLVQNGDTYSFCGSFDELTGRARTAVGLASSEGLCAKDDLALIDLNDNSGYDFKEIAQVISDRFKEQFGVRP